MSEMEVKNYIKSAWDKIPLNYPLDNIVAVNFLSGFAELEFSEAIKDGSKYFANKNVQSYLAEINRISIKWLQPYFDEKQSSIRMPLKNLGLFASWKKLACFDKEIPYGELCNIPNSAQDAISYCLDKLGVKDADIFELFLYLLSSLSGWASYIKFYSEKSSSADEEQDLKIEFIAFRISLFTIFQLDLVKVLEEDSAIEFSLSSIEQDENTYLKDLTNRLGSTITKEEEDVSSQFVFCIDVRSEPIRSLIENSGKYHTYSCAGFFGLPISLEYSQIDESYQSCPAILNPEYALQATIASGKLSQKSLNERLKIAIFHNQIFQALKYNISTAFYLVDILGPLYAAALVLRSFVPKLLDLSSKKLERIFLPETTHQIDVSSIGIENKVNLAASILKLIGLTKNFANYVIFCGHGSKTVNNAFASSLDCGACAGRHGGDNAKVLAMILMDPEVRLKLSEQDIVIPDSTIFLGAEHNTTTSEVEIYAKKEYLSDPNFKNIVEDLEKVRKAISISREQVHQSDAYCNFSEPRPEWGLARNAAFIIAPRSFSSKAHLEARAFLHSYEYEEDIDGSILKSILAGPGMVTHMINMQYLLSAFNNGIFGAGNKITKNIYGKSAVIQGCGSDLMHGLPFQSVYKSDYEMYHKLQRLAVIIRAPKAIIIKAIDDIPNLRQLITNKWIIFMCIEPEDQKYYRLTSKLLWKPF